MTLRKRLDRLEGAMAARPAQGAAATFAALAAALDQMAVRKVARCATVQCDLAALVVSLDGGENGKAAKAT